MSDTTRKSSKDYAAKYRQKMRDRDWSAKEVWLHNDDWPEILAAIAEKRAAREQTIGQK